ncbi:hypothetical protein RaK2_00317 [Klebsiella phage vB_KleM_RaK2]|uniref:DUF1190 domain-containing protein n=1 Tax=Klebsiella phage vB_KleM_RaK2 TaxID=1147094 RepID=H6X4C4_9CAUD|nr:hypothetical protein F403_gp218 [Klebsiella phage vB_KleM_RaK2]AFA44590.1 hypothetical protein RaK2_00317 [Klebsiella phage vB_KleM_RaK2]
MKRITRITRSKNVIRDRFRKVNIIKYSTIALALSTTFVLTACDEPTNVDVYKSLEQCKTSGKNPAQCEEDYKNALKQSVSTAPHYKSQSECYADFDTVCQEGHYSTGGMFFYPMMTGFHSSGQGYHSQPLYSHKGNYVDAGGNNYGSTYSTTTNRTVPRSGLTQKAPTSTITRSGFGSTVSSRSFSSSHSSSSHSFGG